MASVAPPEKPRCSVEGCASPRRKRGWCGGHYAQWYRSGEPPKPFGYKWAQRSDCKLCGKPSGDGLREFCSKACWYVWRHHDGVRPVAVPCVACGVQIDLLERGSRGQLRKASVKFCRPCKRDYNKYKMSAREIALRDGTDCGICREPVDMSLARSDGLMCPSVDHVLPRALGGTHDAENLQLAHLRCNMVKSDRVAAGAA